MVETGQKRSEILILGVQGLSYNNFTPAEIKIGLKLVEHSQQIIKQYSIPMHLTHDSYWLPPEQIAAGHAVITMKLKELGFGNTHLDWLRNTLYGMQKKRLDIPFKVGKMTSHATFAQLFKVDIYKNRHGIWMADFTLDNALVRFFYSFDKGAGRIDLNAINACRSASSIKLYILMNCLAMKGFCHISPEHLMGILHGVPNYYKTWSALERKSLAFAFGDLKRLYDNNIIDQHLTYKPYFNEEEGDLKHHHMPHHITLTLHDRQNSGDVPKDEVSDELKGQRCKLKMLLEWRYKIATQKAYELSQHLTLDMIGELQDWFSHKDYYIEKCKKEHHRMDVAHYIAKGLAGFFHDRKV